MTKAEFFNELEFRTGRVLTPYIGKKIDADLKKEVIAAIERAHLEWRSELVKQGEYHWANMISVVVGTGDIKKHMGEAFQRFGV